jgi:hypothetical protein
VCQGAGHDLLVGARRAYGVLIVGLLAGLGLGLLGLPALIERGVEASL